MPAAPCALEGFGGLPFADCTIERPILVDRFELTRRDWLHYDPEGARAAEALFGASPLARLDEERLDWPAYPSWGEAARLAELRGMRLLLAREWIHVAVGRRSLVYPYGGLQPQESWANTLELGLGTLAPVGTFETGKTQRFGCYDVLGNVWEWVADVLPGYDDPPLGRRRSLPGDGLASAVGGAFDSATRRTFLWSGWPDYELRFHALLLDRRTRSPSIGVRMGADAERYLPAAAAGWGSGDEARERVRAVGRRWAASSGRELVLPFLDALARAPGAPEGLAWLAEGAAGGR